MDKIKPLSAWTISDGTKVFVICIAKHSETKEQLVIFKFIDEAQTEIEYAYACPLDDFINGNLGDRIVTDFKLKDEPEDRQADFLTLWNHFKGARSIVITSAVKTTTGERLIVYRCMDNAKSGTNHSDDIYARPYDMFMDKTDRNKYPNATQENRFEKDSEDAYNRKTLAN